MTEYKKYSLYLNEFRKNLEVVVPFMQHPG